MATKTKKSKSSQNELLKVLQKTYPFFERHGNTLLLGVAAVLAVVAVFIFMSKWSVSGDDAGWAEMSAASKTEDYAGIAERYPGTKVGMWAKLIEADSYQQSAAQLAFTDRAASQRELKQANEKYDTLLRMNISPAVEEKALFGIAKCTESACEGDTSDAIAAYERVIEMFPDSIYKDAIEQRIANLNKPETKEFYAFWHSQNPKPGDRMPPGDAMPLGGLQGVTLPETPLLLQQSGFNVPDLNAENPAPPDFEPADSDAPIQPELQPDSTSTPDARDAAPESADDAKSADTPDEKPADESGEASDVTPNEEPAADPATDGNNESR